MKQTTLMASIILSSVLGAGCVSQAEQGRVGMPNPASVYCLEKGGQSVSARSEDGGEYAICHLPDGTQIEEWALFRRDHPQASQ